MYCCGIWIVFIVTLVGVRANGTPLDVKDCSKNKYGRLATVDYVSIVEDAIRVPGTTSISGAVKVLKPITVGVTVDVTVKMYYSWWYGYYTVLSKTFDVCDVLASYEGTCPLSRGNNCKCPIQTGTMEVGKPYSFNIPVQKQEYQKYLDDRYFWINIKLKSRTGSEVGCTDVTFYVNP